VPVIGNGDVQTPADIDRILAHTDCQAVMIGRGAIGNPWIFARRDKGDVTLADVLAAVRVHSREMMIYYGERSGLLQFRKHLKRYLDDFPIAPDEMTALLQAETAVTFDALLAELETAVTTHQPEKTLAF
jgi:tRNA-dihydrouridine synthase